MIFIKIKKALEEIEFSIKHFEHIDIDKEKKDLRLFKKPRNYSQCYKTSTNFFNIYFFWGGV